jgi:soluble lytic murein transglycosylase-like protein
MSDGESKPSRRKRAPASSESQTDNEPKPPRRRKAVEAGAPESGRPRGPRRAAPQSTEAERAAEKARPRPKRRAAVPKAAEAEKARPPRRASDQAGKDREKLTKELTKEAKGLPKGRVARAIWAARLIVRYSPVWGLLLILLILFIRARFPPPNTVVAPLFTPEVQHWAPQIVRWAQEYDVNANLIATLMQIESCGLPGASSGAGAQGLFQVMPANFEDDEQARMTDPETNAKAGIRIIRDCLRYAEGDVGLAMACYNGGPRLIYISPVYWPAETQHYYTWGSGIYNDAIRNASQSDTLNAWLAAGGIGLCQRAASALGLTTGATLSTPLTNPTIPFTPSPVLPTLSVIETGAPGVTPVPGGLPTFAMPTSTTDARLALTPFR